MASPGLALRDFPPRVPFRPGLVVGLVFAVGIAAADYRGLIPESFKTLPEVMQDAFRKEGEAKGPPKDANSFSLLHPLPLLGHGLALALLVTLFLDRLCLRRRWQELETLEDTSQEHWARRALREVANSLRPGATGTVFREQLQRQQLDWGQTLDGRWTAYYLLGGLLFAPGTALVVLQMMRMPGSLPEPLVFFGPLALGIVETILLLLVAYWVRGQWDDLFQTWAERGLEVQLSRISFDPNVAASEASRIQPAYRPTAPKPFGTPQEDDDVAIPLDPIPDDIYVAEPVTSELRFPQYTPVQPPVTPFRRSELAPAQDSRQSESPTWGDKQPPPVGVGEEEIADALVAEEDEFATQGDPAVLPKLPGTPTPPVGKPTPPVKPPVPSPSTPTPMPTGLDNEDSMATLLMQKQAVATDLADEQQINADEDADKGSEVELVFDRNPESEND